MSARGLVVLLVCSALAVAAAWWWRSGGPGDAESVADPSAESGVVQQFAVGQRDTPEAFEADLLDGTQFDSESLVGAVAVVNVWGSWCGPCRSEAPVLARVAREFRSEVGFVGINVRDNDAAARAFEQSYRMPYPSITTADSGTALLAFGGALASTAVPSTVVLDVDGAVAARVVGPVTYRTLVVLLEDAGANRTG